MAAAAAGLGERCQHDVPIGPRTTYRVGGQAALYFEARHLDDLRRAAAVVAATPIPVAVLGRGSNLLVADAGFAGLVVAPTGDLFTAVDLTAGGAGTESGADARDDGCLVRAGGAVALPVLARQTAAAGLTGLEWAVGVPGSVGGAVRMNAGGHGADIAGCLASCRLFDLGTGALATATPADLDFGYRHSAVAAHQVVVDADFRVTPGDREASEATIRQIQRWRREHQPGGQNAGSVFINPRRDPPADSAGRLVDGAGLKGLRRGTAMVSTKHANFIQADPGGSADDVVALMGEVQQRVKARWGITLRAEVRLLGFPEALLSTLGLASQPSPDPDAERPAR
ncbi:MAG TPA: UDP-N-acetylmuramate dehydrogenase [Acidimicrobiales bacterium]|nr:UDP-N-acetylmuramate dehydrogenase [Acidimicrobiales bacterium]